VSPQLRRFAPFILIALVLLFVLPLIRGRSSSGLNDGERATDTLNALKLIDRTQQSLLSTTGRYTSHLSDIIGSAKGLAGDLAIGVGVQLDAGTDGQSYYVQLNSSVLSVSRARAGTKRTVNTCLVLKSSSGVKCPLDATPPTTTTATSTTATTPPASTGTTTTTG
jgi:hypothetical protein